MTLKSKPAEAKVLQGLTTKRTDMAGVTLPLWNEKKLDMSTSTAFSDDYKKSLTSCRNCSNGTCPTCKTRQYIESQGKAEHADQGDVSTSSLKHNESDIEYVIHDESSLITQEQVDTLAELQVKGGQGSGYFGPRPKEQDSDWGGSAPRSGGDLRKAVQSRVKFQKNRLSKEIVSHASRVRQLEEKPFRTVADRVEARRHMKALRSKTKELGVKDEQVWEVIDELPPNQQAYLASLANVPKNNSKALKIVKNIGTHLGLSAVSRLASRKDRKGEYIFAPSPLSEPETVSKFSFAETAAYLAAHGNPKLAPAFIKALSEGDIDKAKRIRSIGSQDIISNWSRNTRNENYLNAAARIHKAIETRKKIDSEYYVTQREREKMISQLLKKESDMRLRSHRRRPSVVVPGRPDRSPLLPYGGFGGNP